MTESSDTYITSCSLFNLPNLTYPDTGPEPKSALSPDLSLPVAARLQRIYQQIDKKKIHKDIPF